MKRNIFIAFVAFVTLFTSFPTFADSFDEAIDNISDMNKVDVTTMSKSMINSVNMPFSNYNLDSVKHNMTSMTVITSESDLPKIRQILKDATKQAGYATLLHQKDEDGESAKILARNAEADTYSRLVFIMDDCDEITFVSIDGKFTNEDISSLSKRPNNNPQHTTSGVFTYPPDLANPTDTVGMTTEMKIQYLKKLQKQYTEGLEQYKKNTEQYKKGLEQYQKGMEQYSQKLLQNSKELRQQQHQKYVARFKAIRKRLKDEAGIELPRSFDNAYFICEPDTTDLRYHNKGQKKQHITIDRYGNITVNGKKVATATKKGK